jgi:hypothetical protein
MRLVVQKEEMLVKPMEGTSAQDFQAWHDAFAKVGVYGVEGVEGVEDVEDV